MTGYHDWLEDPIARDAPMGIFITDAEGIILAANPHAVGLLGADDISEVTTRSVFQHFDGEMHDLKTSFDTCRVKAESVQCGCAGRTQFGATVDCEVRILCIPAEKGRPGGFCWYFVDVSGRTALYESLLHTEKLSALGEIVAGVAHELNNPLTGILGYAQLLLGSDTDETVRKRLEQISLEAQRCRKIVQGLLGFSRHYDSEKSLQSLNDILQDTLTLREYQLRVDDIQVDTELSKQLPAIEVDPHELQRVFLNIINNAHYALISVKDRDRLFRIRSGIVKDEVYISFEDNGSGIPKEIQRKIFEPFYTTKGVGEGTGLGLSVSYGVISDHGGRIAVESEVGRGSIFTVFLPTAGATGALET